MGGPCVDARARGSSVAPFDGAAADSVGGPHRLGDQRADSLRLAPIGGAPVPPCEQEAAMERPGPLPADREGARTTAGSSGDNAPPESDEGDQEAVNRETVKPPRSLQVMASSADWSGVYQSENGKCYRKKGSYTNAEVMASHSLNKIHDYVRMLPREAVQESHDPTQDVPFESIADFVETMHIACQPGGPFEWPSENRRFKKVLGSLAAPPTARGSSAHQEQ